MKYESRKRRDSISIEISQLELGIQNFWKLVKRRMIANGLAM